MSQSVYEQYIKEKIDQGQAPENIVRDLRAAFPDLTIEEATPVIYYLTTCTKRAQAKTLTTAEASTGEAVKILAVETDPGELPLPRIPAFRRVVLVTAAAPPVLAGVEHRRDHQRPENAPENERQLLAPGEPHE